MPSNKKTAKKGGKRGRDPSMYGAVGVPSKAKQPETPVVVVAAATPDPEPISQVAEKTVCKGDHEAELLELENRVQEPKGGDVSAVDAWVSMSLARKQASARVHSEERMKLARTSSHTAGNGKGCGGPLVVLTQWSEQLVVDQIRSNQLRLPHPHPDGTTRPLLVPLRDWTRSANFVFETAALYGFADGDIAAAMEATGGAGGLVDVVAWLCVHVPADKMPPDMRDKLECGSSGGRSIKLQQPESPLVDGSDPVLKSGARIDEVPDKKAGVVAVDHALAALLRERGLDWEEDESDKETDIEHAHRLVRVNACSEILAFYQGSSVVRGPQKKANVDAIMEIMTRETRRIAVLEDDMLFNKRDAEREFRQQWQACYGPLLEAIRNLENSYNGEKEVARARQNGKPSSGKPLAESCDGDDEDEDSIGFGLDLMLAAGDEEHSAPQPQSFSAAGDAVRIVDTAAPSGWTGPLVRDLVVETVRRFDKQAEIRYHTAHEKSHAGGYTASLSIDWLLPGVAKQAVQNQRRIQSVADQQPPVFGQATTGLKHIWSSPPSMRGRTKRAAEDLAALVFLYTQHTLCHNAALRLAPVLHGIWSEWEAAAVDSASATRERARAGRVEFLRRLRTQYESRATDNKAHGQPSGISTQQQAESSTNKRDAHRQHARRIRRQKWTGTTIQTRQGTSEWRAKYGVVRQQLPARRHADEIKRAVMASQVVIVRGETGSGKSSQVPQMVLELLLGKPGGYGGGRVICTQPRRISATAIAARVSEELGDPARPGSSGGSALGTGNSLVGVQIRFSSQARNENALVFCTTGVLLRMLMDDPELAGAACVICDEVQERTLELDYLLIVLRRLLRRRPDLKVVLMSATIDASIFACYFGGCPVVEIPGRTFPVDQVFLEDILQRSGYAPACSTGTRHAVRPSSRCAATVDIELVHFLLRGICAPTSTNGAGVEDGGGQSWRAFCRDAAGPRGSVLVFLPGIHEIRQLHNRLLGDAAVSSAAAIVPLHSSFANETAPGTALTYTEAAFAPPLLLQGNKQRKIVLSTNVAETGITIPDVAVVIDSGLSNQTRWDKERRLARLEKHPVSRASVRQRCGRAGRIQPGLALCLYTRTQHALMAEFERPEMQRLSLASICLQTRALGLGDIMQFLQQAPEPPQQSAVMQAVFELQEAGALDEDEELTPIGRHLCYLPLDLTVGKLLVVGALLGCLDPVLTVAASLSTTASVLQPPFAGSALQPSADIAHAKYRNNAMRFLSFTDCGGGNRESSRALSDFLVVLAAYEDWRKTATQQQQQQPGSNRAKLAGFCRANGLNMDALEELEDCREQYLRLLATTGIAAADNRPARPREGSSNTRGGGVRFVAVPAAANANGSSISMVYASLVAGLNHVLMPRTHGLSGYAIGQTTKTKRVEGIGRAIQIVDRERVATRPIGIDSRSAIATATTDNSSHAVLPPRTAALVAATISGSRTTMTAHTLTAVNLAVLVLFARSLGFWPKAQHLVINRWIETRCCARTASVLILMRRLLDRILHFRFAHPQRPLPEDLEAWQAAIVAVIKNEGG
ncbi:hypothetical protein GGI11_000189 [Coemansia sp. RSA 2049]|nr:hypothetical protein GGI11_000189 [Coemansia sp. RSA 2049]